LRESGEKILEKELREDDEYGKVASMPFFLAVAAAAPFLKKTASHT
jgi:hypothetical protein